MTNCFSWRYLLNLHLSNSSIHVSITPAKITKEKKKEKKKVFLVRYCKKPNYWNIVNRIKLFFLIKCIDYTMENLNENYYMSKKIRILESKKGSIMRHQKQWSSHFVIWNFQSLVPLSALNSSLANSGDCCIPSKAKKRKEKKNKLS